MQRAVKAAVLRAGVPKRASGHTVRHPFAAHRREDGDDIRTAQERLGPTDVSPTMISTHVLHRGGLGVRSPMDRAVPVTPGMPARAGRGRRAGGRAGLGGAAAQSLAPVGLPGQARNVGCEHEMAACLPTGCGRARLRRAPHEPK